VIPGLTSWFEENRRPLPWRAVYDPYHVWVSEAMLQQTQVETVLPYYEKFIREFPTVHALAIADEERVLRVWSGLGYYRRAKNLRLAAQAVVRKHAGAIPSTYEAIIELPGVGRYMAGAILSIAFNKPYPVVDGNVRRVLSRIYGWMDDNPKQLWKAAEDLVRNGEPRQINQAIMELGATVCSFRAPRCLLCPVQSSCAAFKTGMQHQIPPVKKRPPTVHVHLCAVVHRRGLEYLMKSAGGMWEFPMYTELPEGEFSEIGVCRHTITHHRLRVRVYAGKLKSITEYKWKVPSTVPTSSLTRKILSAALPLAIGNCSLPIGHFPENEQ